MKTILTIEHNDSFQDNLIECLVMENYRVVGAVNGKIGIENDILIGVAENISIIFVLISFAYTKTFYNIIYLICESVICSLLIYHRNKLQNQINLFIATL